MTKENAQDPINALVGGAYQKIMDQTTDQDRQDMLDDIAFHHGSKGAWDTIEKAVKEYAQSIGVSDESVNTMLDGCDGDTLVALIVEKISDAPFRGKAFDDGGPEIDPARITKNAQRTKNA